MNRILSDTTESLRAKMLRLAMHRQDSKVDQRSKPRRADIFIHPRVKKPIEWVVFSQVRFEDFRYNKI